MKQTVHLDTFRSAFQEIRTNNFSYEGLSILFDYFQEYESSTDTEIELDVIAICCEYSEEPWQDIADSYNIDLSDWDTDEDRLQCVIDYLNENTQYCGTTDNGSIVYLQF